MMEQLFAIVLTKQTGKASLTVFSSSLNNNRSDLVAHFKKTWKKPENVKKMIAPLSFITVTFTVNSKEYVSILVYFVT